jgi:hypothetical protein
MKTKLSFALLGILIIAALVAIRATLGRHAADDAAFATESRAADLERTITAAKTRLRVLDQASAALEKQIAKTNAPDAMPSSQPAPQLSPHSLIANDPVKMAAYTRDFRASLDLEYGGLQKFAGLSPEVYEKVKDLRTAREQRRMDILAVAEMQGMDVKSPGYRALQKKEADEFARSEAELLGSLTEKYRAFERTQPVRESARRLGSSETYPEPPLTTAQIERVVDVLASHSQRNPEDGTVWKHTTNMRTAMPELQTFLSPELAATFTWAVPGGLMNRIVSRVEQIVAPLNARLPSEKRRTGWSLWYIDPPNTPTTAKVQ